MFLVDRPHEEVADERDDEESGHEEHGRIVKRRGGIMGAFGGDFQ